MPQATTARRTRPTRITSKGQVTIPSAVRRTIGLQPGDAVEFVQEGTRYFVARAADPEAERVARELGYANAEALARALEEGPPDGPGLRRDAEAWLPLSEEAWETSQEHRRRRR